MFQVPAGAKKIDSVLEYGVDQKGEWVFFGFNLSEGNPLYIETHYRHLAGTIHYLQAIAVQAERLRTRLNPALVDMDPQSREPDPVYSIDFQASIDGTTALAKYLTMNGTPVEVQMPFNLVETLQSELPALLAEMAKRQAKTDKTH